MNTSDESEFPICRRIVLIDDRRDSILPVQRMLELIGHEVFTASSGTTGVALARQLNPDLILCDIGLPGAMNGYEVAAALRSDPVCRNVYLVAYSGYGEDEHRERARQAGFDFHMTKPANKDKLEQLVNLMPRFSATERKHPGWPGSH